MPLNEQQKSFIDETLSHFFNDLPGDNDPFVAEIGKFKSAFDPNPLPENHPYAQLQKCIHAPQEMLLTLENSNRNITLDEVQTYVGCYITYRLIAQATHLRCALHPHWNLTNLLMTCAQQTNADKLFQSHFQNRDILIYDPYEIQPKDRLYKARLIPNPDFLTVTLRITFYLDEAEIDKMEMPFREFPLELIVRNGAQDDGTRFNTFIEQIRTDAEIKAQEKAAEMILSYCIQSEIIADEFLWSTSDAAKILLTHPFYFKAICNKRYVFNNLSNASESEVNTLLAPATIALLDASACSLEDAKSFTPPSLVVLSIPYFRELAKTHRDQLQELGWITEPESKNLISPPIQHLLRLNKISLKQAKMLLPRLRALLRNKPYFDAAMENPHLMFSGTLNDHQLKNFSHPAIISLVGEKILSVSTLIHLPTNAGKVVSNPTINHLIRHHWVDVCCICYYFKDQSIERTSPENIILAAILLRLNSIYLQRPYFLPDRKDTIAQIQRDLPAISHFFSLSEETLRTTIIQQFLSALKHLIPKPSEWIHQSVHKTIVTYEINVLQANNPTLLPNCLRKILTLVSDELSRLSSAPQSPMAAYTFPKISHLFQPSPPRTEKIREFCHFMKEFVNVGLKEVELQITMQMH